MKTRKVISILLVLLVFAMSLWYLVFKDYNYKITFESSQPPGVIYATLTDWEHLNKSLKDSLNYDSRSPFSSVDYHLFRNDSTFNYKWQIEAKNDSTTKVVAYITNKGSSLKQNLTVPFKKNDFVTGNISEVKRVMTYLSTLESVYKLTILKDSIVTIPPKYCAYIPIRSTISGKANSMLNNISLLSDFINSSQLKLDGDPFLSITSMDMKNGLLEYDFCFPIKKGTALPKSDFVKVKTTEEFNAIKAVFNGNYRSTEYAWYELLRYAEQNNIDILRQPIEIFKSDPKSGTDASDWLAEVYLPLKE